MHRGLEVLLLVELILQTLAIHNHVLLIALHDRTLLEIGEVRLDVRLKISRGLLADLPTELGDLLREYNGK